VRHAPHREAPDALLRIAADFTAHLFIDHRESAKLVNWCEQRRGPSVNGG
jgi:hypothetical protein